MFKLDLPHSNDTSYHVYELSDEFLRKLYFLPSRLKFHHGGNRFSGTIQSLPTKRTPKMVWTVEHKNKRSRLIDQATLHLHYPLSSTAI